MPRIRVVQLVAGLAIGDQSGGAEFFGLQLARHLDQSEFEPVIFSMWQYGSSAEGTWLATLEREGIPVRGLTRYSRWPIGDLKDIFFNLWSLVSVFQPDIIVSHSQRGDPLGLLMQLFHPARPHTIRTVHIEQPWLNRLALDRVFDKGLFPMGFRTEVAVSEAVRQALDRRLLARLLKRKSVLCHNGIEARLFEREITRETRDPPPAGIPDFRPRLAVIGRLTRQKGHFDLLQAMGILRPASPVHLLVIGSGPLESDLRRQVRDLGLQDCVHFLGSRNDVLEILPHVDLVVSSSRWEGFATVLLEAMALGVPVVATDVSGSRELVNRGQTGMLVRPADPVHLAEGIRAMLENPARAQSMAENARRFASGFTIQNAASCHAQIYKRLVNSDAGGRAGSGPAA